MRVKVSGGGELLTTGWSSCCGDATVRPVRALLLRGVTKAHHRRPDLQVMTIRGKLRHGFDFNLHVSWVAKLEATAELAEREVKGTVVIQDASRDAVQARPNTPCMALMRRQGTDACPCLLVPV